MPLNRLPFLSQLNPGQRGALWMLLASVCFSLMGALVKLGSAHFSTPELVFYRSFVSLLFVYAMIVWRGQSVRTPYLKVHLLRSLSGTASLLMSFYAVTHLPLAAATTLTYTSSIFLAVLTVVVFKRRPPASLVLAVVLGFVGVLGLLRPSFTAGTLGAALIGLGSGLLAAVAYLNIKELGKLGEPGWRVVFYFTLTASVIAAVGMLFDDFHALTGRSALILIGIGATATVAQLALTRAYGQGRTLVVASFAYSTVVFSALLGLVLWQDLLAPVAWLGIGLVVASGVLSIYASRD